jgi:cytidylate kinase
MTANTNRLIYVPGAYARKRPDAAQIADKYIKDWVKKQLQTKPAKFEPVKIPPAICFSRKIGSGALEIADILAEKLQYRVADRELLDYMAKDAEISKDTLAFFDERYPGKRSELASRLFGERSFIMSDYIQNFVSAVFTFADMGSTVFVGRGIHLFLPRDRVLAVRIIASNHTRVSRLAKILNLEAKDVQEVLNQVDREQDEFFKKAFGQKEASPYEFDIFINCDFIASPPGAAEIVARAFQEKFPVGSF